MITTNPIPNSYLMKFIAIFTFCICSFLVKGQVNTFVYSQNKDLLIGKGVLVLEDKKNALTTSDVLNSKDFQEYKKQVVNLGVSSSAFWLQFSVFNNSGDSNLLLSIAQPTLNFAELYIVNANGKFTVQRAGTSFPFEKRYYKY